uniref:Radical SAM domain protein n=1 Tax=uncultured bacterium AB_9 TaxID=1630012 RepID=A0A0E3JHU5_9BACT|nr:radical SAM domain protein [uncultured bacterium AB_9]
MNMPFAAWNRPSFALSQLSTLLQQTFPDEISVGVHHANVDFAERFGAAAYESITDQLEHLHSGIGDWLFRGIAFPDAPDNSDEYFRRFYRGERWAAFRELIHEQRAEIRQTCLEVIDRYDLASADLVGFTSMFAQTGANLAIAALLKEANPRIITVMGGANCEAPMGAVLAQRCHNLDYLFSGPALQTFPQLLRMVLDDRLADADELPGVLSRRNCTDPRFRKAIGPNRDIDDLLEPDYSSFLGALDAHPELLAQSDAETTLFFETSRGCWWGERSHCTFCGLNGQSMTYGSMRSDLAVEQFRRLFQHAPRIKAFYCTDNVMPRHYPKEVFTRLDPPAADSYVYYEVKLPLSRQDLATMARAGVTTVQPGVEAIATSTLKLMGKGTTAFQNIQFLKNCCEYGITPDWNLLIGFPGEQPEVYEKYLADLPMLRHLPPPHGVYLVRFDRFSPYFNKAAEYGLQLRPMDYYGLIYPFPETEIADIAYFFADSSLTAYQIESAKHHDALRQLVTQWQAGRLQPGGEPRQLRLVETDGFSIVDSRLDPARVHEVDAVTARLIRRLASPARPAQLRTTWPEGPADLDGRLAWLRERDMLFTEGDKVLSLVLDEHEREESPAVAAATGAGSAPAPLLTITRGRPDRSAG